LGGGSWARSPAPAGRRLTSYLSCAYHGAVPATAVTCQLYVGGWQSLFPPNRRGVFRANPERSPTFCRAVYATFPRPVRRPPLRAAATSRNAWLAGWRAEVAVRGVGEWATVWQKKRFRARIRRMVSRTMRASEYRVWTRRSPDGATWFRPPKPTQPYRRCDGVKEGHNRPDWDWDLGGLRGVGR